MYVCMYICKIERDTIKYTCGVRLYDMSSFRVFFLNRKFINTR